MFMLNDPRKDGQRTSGKSARPEDDGTGVAEGMEENGQENALSVVIQPSVQEGRRLYGGQRFGSAGGDPPPQRCNIRGDGEVRPTDVECYTGRQVITPNNDGKNDELEIACAPAIENELEIFDRWGVRVFRQDNYDNSWRGMDGGGTELPDGGYFWVLRVTDPGGLVKLHKGHVTIVRKFN